MKMTILILKFLFVAHCVLGQHNIIPQPVEYTSSDGVFILTPQTRIITQTGNPNVKTYVSQFRKDLFLKDLSGDDSEETDFENTITIVLPPSTLAKNNPEGYTMQVRPKSMLITATGHAGIFYALQTLKQMSLEKNHHDGFKYTIPCCTINDYPRFKWRGLMLDCSRHFFTVDEVKAYIDKMSTYKFNTFHWHLTDDEGWRIEIKALPKLTEVGAWRVTRHGRFGDTRPYPREGEKADYGGYYTHEEIKDIVAYAAERHITIVPEIDMPGHCMAALAAYPELSVFKEPKFVNPGSKFAEWYAGGRFDMLIENTLNPTDESVYDFVDKVMTEVAELFPGPYIHMGGDECYKGFWEKSEVVQKFMDKKGIGDVHDLQAYFVSRVHAIVESKGKKMIGWDEISEGDLPSSAIVMGWRGYRGGTEAAKRGYKVVMSPTDHVYLDYTQGDHTLENPIYADLSLKKCYGFDPLPEGVDPNNILGGQGNVWTEAIPTIQFAFYMTYPRAFAISESLWSLKKNKDWKDFTRRVEYHFDRFDDQNINICKALYDPIVEVEMVDGKLICTLSNDLPDTRIYYTIDNTYPARFGILYTGPFEIPEGDIRLHVQTYREDQQLGRALVITRFELERRL